MGPGESELIYIHMSPNKYYRNSSQLGPIHLIRIQLNNEQTWATVVGIREEGKLVNMQTEHGETFLMKTEGQDIALGYTTLREAIQRTSPTLVRLSQQTSQTAYMA